MDIHITRNGEQHGPYPEASAREMLAAGQLQPTDLAWHAGADGWKPLSEVLGVGAQPAATPPPPPKPPGGGIPKRTMAGAAPAEEKPAEEKSEDSEAEDPNKIRVTRKGEPIGPYSREKAEKYFADGQLLPTDWGWHDGMDEWKPLYEVLGVEVSPGPGAGAAASYSGTGGAWTIGDCLSEGMESFKGNLGGAVLLTLVFMIVIGITGMLPLINLFLSGPIAAGMLYFFIKQVRREPTAIGDMFAGFKRGYAQLLLLSILSILIWIVATLPGISFILLGAAQGVGEVRDSMQEGSKTITTLSELTSAFRTAGVYGARLTAGLALIIFLPLISLSFTFFSTPLVIDRQMKALDALKASARLMKGQWFKVALFFILVGIISQVGIIALGIGLLFTFPIAMSAVASCYLKNASGLTDAHTAPISQGMKIALILMCVLPIGGGVTAGLMIDKAIKDIAEVAKEDTNETDPGGQPGATKNEIVGTYMWDTSPFSQVGFPMWVELNEGGTGNFFVGPINPNRPSPPKPIMWEIDPENDGEVIVNMDEQVFLRARITPGGGLKLLEFAKEQGQEAEPLDEGEQLEAVKKGTLVGQYAGGGGNRLVLRKDQKAAWVINRQPIQGTWYIRHNPGSIKGEVLFFSRQAQFLFSINSGQKPVSLTSAARLVQDPATRSLKRVSLPAQGQMTYTRSKGGPGGGRPPGGAQGGPGGGRPPGGAKGGPGGGRPPGFGPPPKPGGK